MHVAHRCPVLPASKCRAPLPLSIFCAGGTQQLLPDLLIYADGTQGPKVADSSYNGGRLPDSTAVVAGGAAAAFNPAPWAALQWYVVWPHSPLDASKYAGLSFKLAAAAAATLDVSVGVQVATAAAPDGVPKVGRACGNSSGHKNGCRMGGPCCRHGLPRTAACTAGLGRLPLAVPPALPPTALIDPSNWLQSVPLARYLQGGRVLTTWQAVFVPLADLGASADLARTLSFFWATGSSSSAAGLQQPTLYLDSILLAALPPACPSAPLLPPPPPLVPRPPPLRPPPPPPIRRPPAAAPPPPAPPPSSRSLYTSGNRILWPNGTRFSGRGVNLFDTRRWAGGREGLESVSRGTVRDLHAFAPSPAIPQLQRVPGQPERSRGQAAYRICRQADVRQLGEALLGEQRGGRGGGTCRGACHGWPAQRMRGSLCHSITCPGPPLPPRCWYRRGARLLRLVLELRMAGDPSDPSNGAQYCTPACTASDAYLADVRELVRFAGLQHDGVQVLLSLWNSNYAWWATRVVHAVRCMLRLRPTSAVPRSRTHHARTCRRAAAARLWPEQHACPAAVGYFGRLPTPGCPLAGRPALCAQGQHGPGLAHQRNPGALAAHRGGGWGIPLGLVWRRERAPKQL